MMWKRLKKNTVPTIALTGLAAAIGAVLRAVTISNTARLFTIPAGFCVGLVMTSACLLVTVLLQNRTSNRRPRGRSKRFRVSGIVYPVLFTAIAALPGALFGLSLAVFMPIVDAVLHLTMPSPLYWIASGAVYGVIWGGCVLAALVLVVLLNDWKKSRR
jgi:hypothetical protein